MSDRWDLICGGTPVDASEKPTKLHFACRHGGQEVLANTNVQTDGHFQLVSGCMPCGCSYWVTSQNGKIVILVAEPQRVVFQTPPQAPPQTPVPEAKPTAKIDLLLEAIGFVLCIVFNRIVWGIGLLGVSILCFLPMAIEAKKASDKDEVMLKHNIQSVISHSTVNPPRSLALLEESLEHMNTAEFPYGLDFANDLSTLRMNSVLVKGKLEEIVKESSKERENESMVNLTPSLHKLKPMNNIPTRAFAPIFGTVICLILGIVCIASSVED